MLEPADVGVAGWSFSASRASPEMDEERGTSVRSGVRTRWGLESERPSRLIDNEPEEDMLECKMGRCKVEVERKVGAPAGDLLEEDPRSIDGRPRSVVGRSIERISFISGSEDVDSTIEKLPEERFVDGVSLELWSAEAASGEMELD